MCFQHGLLEVVWIWSSGYTSGRFDLRLVCKYWKENRFYRKWEILHGLFLCTDVRMLAFLGKHCFRNAFCAAFYSWLYLFFFFMFVYVMLCSIFSVRGELDIAKSFLYGNAPSRVFSVSDGSWSSVSVLRMLYLFGSRIISAPQKEKIHLKFF